MGGSGSGRWHDYAKRLTVEECYKLDINWIVRQGGLLRDQNEIHYSINQQSIGWINYHFASYSDGGLARKALVLEYKLDQEPIRYAIPITETQPTFGGTRLWMHCPILKNGAPCRRKVSKLYMPIGAKCFGCRECWNLTYTSSQESHQFDTVFKNLARDVGADFSFVKRALGDQYTIAKRRNRNRRTWRRLPI